MDEPFEIPAEAKAIWRKQIVAIIIGTVLGYFAMRYIFANYPFLRDVIILGLGRLF